MRRAARLLTRKVGFALLRISRYSERLSRALACASFTPEELRALQVAEWEAFAEQGAYSDHRLFDWEEDLFARHVLPHDRILVVGAGTGRDVFPLLSAGHPVTALDIAPRALRTLQERARSAGREVATIHASIDAADLAPSAFDVIVFSWFCFSYLMGAGNRLKALERSRDALRPGGRILISYQLRAGRELSAPRPSTLGASLARWLGGTEPEPGDVVNMVGPASRPSVFRSHSFTPDEAEAEAREAGLAIAAHGQTSPAIGLLVLTSGPDGSRRP